MGFSTVFKAVKEFPTLSNMFSNCVQTRVSLFLAICSKSLFLVFGVIFGKEAIFAKVFWFFNINCYLYKQHWFYS